MKNQLGERAAGVLDIFAKANNMTVKELFKAMEAGKVSTQAVYNAALAMGELADAQGGLSEALSLSAAQQTKFNNRLKEMSLIILKSGLDEFLANLFKLGSTVIEPVTQAFKWLFKAIHSVWVILKMLGQRWSDNRTEVSVFIADLVGLTFLLGMVTGRFTILSAAVAGLTRLLVVFLKYISWVRVALVGIALFIADFENYFILKNEDGIIGSWKNMLEDWFITFDYYLARATVAWWEFKDQFDLGETLMKPFRYVGEKLGSAVYDYLNPEEGGSSVTAPKNSGTQNYPTSNLIPTLPIQLPPSQMVTPPMRLPQGSMNINLNIENMPAHIIDKMNRSDWQGFARGLGEGISIGGLGYNIS